MLALPAALESGDSFAYRSPPGTARYSMSLRQIPTTLALPTAHESGDSFADRSPPGMARYSLSLRQ
eukprot:6094880-Pyramimonas_sp.AAC.1